MKTRLEPNKGRNIRYDQLGKEDKSFKHRYPCPYATSDMKNQATHSLPSLNQSLISSKALQPDQAKNGEVDKKARPLPLHNKEDVFNEWGAILRHQDEINQIMQQQNLAKQKMRQMNYKKELDKQYQELMQRKKGRLSELNKKEEENLKYQQQIVENRAIQEETKRRKLQDNLKVDALVGFSEVQTKKQQDQMMKNIEIDMQRDKLEQERKFQLEKEHQQKMKKRDEEIQYSQMLALQAKEKQSKLKQDKESDVRFSQAESIKLKNEEKARDVFFDKLKQIQDNNDKKHKMFLKYMEQDQSVMNSKKDEQSYLNSIQIGEKKATKKEFTDRRDKDYNIQQNSEMLEKQLEEK